MPEPSLEIKAPVAWLPAGLISWYAPDGEPLVLVTSWMALLGGAPPRLRTAWHSRQNTELVAWPGGDFVLNVPCETGLEALRKIMHKGRFCLNAEADLAYSCFSGVAVVAPRLMECAVQIECVGGHLSDTAFDAELCGDVVRVHRGGAELDPLDVPDLCAIHPLSP